MSQTLQSPGRLDQTMVMDVSIAARAYAVAQGALHRFLGHTASPQDQSQPVIVSDIIGAAEVQLTELVNLLDVPWQGLPVTRFLHTQIDLLQDTLIYARPETIRGYGALEPAATAFLTTQCSRLAGLLYNLAQLIDKQAPDPVPETADGDAGPAKVVILNTHQQAALRSYVQAFMQELLLLESYARLGGSPGAPTLTPAYSQAQVSQLLTQAHLIEQALTGLTETFKLPSPWPAATANLVIGYTARAEDSAQRVLHVVSQSGSSHLAKAAAFYRAAHAAYRAALNL
jgi:hypothetical protein